MCHAGTETLSQDCALAARLLPADSPSPRPRLPIPPFPPPPPADRPCIPVLPEIATLQAHGLSAAGPNQVMQNLYVLIAAAQSGLPTNSMVAQGYRK